MRYRKLGKTDLNVSEIGLGLEHVDRKPYEQVKETLDTALEHGVNIIDCFMPGKEIRENIAKALGSRRSNIIIQGAAGATDLKQQYDKSYVLEDVKKYFEELLKIFGYIDIAMLFMLDSEEDYFGVFETDYLDYVCSLKEKGDIRHIGVSSHSPVIAKKAIETNIPEMLFFSLNPAFDMLPPDEHALMQLFGGFNESLLQGIDPKRIELYKLCEQKNIGITVMKTLGGGKLTSAEHTPFAEPLTVQQCIHYALTRPAVASVLLGCQTAAEVEEAMKYYTLTDIERDYTKILSSMRNNFKGACVYCSHCQPCPVSIDIAAVMKYFDIAQLTPDDVPPSIKAHYRNLPASGEDCVKCGACEKRCPFGVHIMDNMAEADKLLS